MPLAPSSSAVRLQPAPSSSASLSRAPTSVRLHPAALFSVLDHYLRRPPGQERVIGTLLGSRAEGSDAVDVRAAFAVLHDETDEQVAVDMEYHQAMFELSQRVSPKESIVGWYSTGSALNTYSALIQNFYAQETAPAPALHLVVDTGVSEGAAPSVRAFLSAPVGVAPKPENAVFVPLPVALAESAPARAGLAYLAQDAGAGAAPVTDLALLEGALGDVLAMLDRVMAYVAKVERGEEKGDPALGRYLMEAFGTAAEELDKGAFANSLQDTLMLSYLANLARAQAEVASRLALVSAA